MNKKFKPAFTVDITECNTNLDVKVSIVLSKINAQIPLTAEDTKTLVEWAIETYCGYAPEKVQVIPVYMQVKKLSLWKRFWNKITFKK
jgi:hypothetical protein